MTFLGAAVQRLVVDTALVDSFRSADEVDHRAIDLVFGACKIIRRADTHDRDKIVLSSPHRGMRIIEELCALMVAPGGT